MVYYVVVNVDLGNRKPVWVGRTEETAEVKARECRDEWEEWSKYPERAKAPYPSPSFEVWELEGED